MSARNVSVAFCYPKLALSLDEAAQALSVSRRTISRLLSRGELRKTSYGVIPVAEIEKHLKTYERNNG